MKAALIRLKGWIKTVVKIVKIYLYKNILTDARNSHTIITIT